MILPVLDSILMDLSQSSAFLGFLNLPFSTTDLALKYKYFFFRCLSYFMKKLVMCYNVMY